MQQTYRIFLASSYELKADREQFEIFITRQNNLLRDKGVYLQVVLWEDIGAEVYPVDKQEHYNDQLRTCDIFVMLYWTKVGKYTNIEFDRALGQFRYTKHNPKIYVFEKTAGVPKSQTATDQESLAAFKQKFDDARQFFTPYKDGKELIELFHTALDRLFAEKYLIYGTAEPAQCLYTDGGAVPAGFIGREDELKTIKQRLEKGGSLMLINAEGGIGKTSLAAKYWQESLYDYKYNAWLFCDNGIIPSIKKLAAKLEVDLAGINEEQQIEALKGKLLNMSKDILLVLDNADKAEDIEQFAKIFDGFYWHVLITSRRSGIFDTEQELHIYHLPPHLAKQLFKANYSEDTADFEILLDRLLEAIGYHTLLVEIFSKNMKLLSEFGETLSEFLNRLETGGLYLQERSFKVITSGRHRDAKNTDEIIEKLYDFSKLEEPERHLMVNLALLPAVKYKLTFLIDLFLPEDKFAFGTLLKTLAGKAWLDFSEEGYRMSPVIQRLVLQKNEGTSQDDSRALIDNLLEKLDSDGTYLLNLNYDEAVPYAQLVPAITDSFKGQAFYSLGVLIDRICIYYIAIGDFPAARKAAEKSIEICIHMQDKKRLTISYSRLGNIFREIGDTYAALNYFQKSLELDQQNCDSEPENDYLKFQLSISYQDLGNVFYSLHDYDKALEYCEKRNKLIWRLRKNHLDNVEYEFGLAVSYTQLGNIFYRLNNFEKALKFQQKSIRLKEKLFERYPDNIYYKKGLAISYQNLGDNYLVSNDPEKALKSYQKYKEIAEQLYRKHEDKIDFKNGLAIAHYKLGAIYVKINQLKIAEVHYLESQRLLKELIITSPEMANFYHSLNWVTDQLRNLK